MKQQAYKSTCSYCGVGCGIVVKKDTRGRLKVEGDPDHPVNRGYPLAWRVDGQLGVGPNPSLAGAWNPEVRRSVAVSVEPAVACAAVPTST